jgi:hypothetical protein
VSENVGDSHCTSAEALMQLENALFEIVRILCIGFSTRSLQLRDFAAVAVLFGKLLDPPPTNLELLGNKPGVHIVINNTLTNSGDIVLIKFHFTWSIVGEIISTKSLADTTIWYTRCSYY